MAKTLKLAHPISAVSVTSHEIKAMAE